jgi:hypothetical protein
LKPSSQVVLRARADLQEFAEALTARVPRDRYVEYSIAHPRGVFRMS